MKTEYIYIKTASDYDTAFILVKQIDKGAYQESRFQRLIATTNYNDVCYHLAKNDILFTCWH